MIDKKQSDEILTLRSKNYSVPEIGRLTGIKNYSLIRKVLEDDKQKAIKYFQSIDKNAEEYNNALINVVRFLRCEYNLNYKQIAEELGMSEYFIFDIIRREPVSAGTHNFVRASFTRGEKIMRNEEMVRLNAEGKTLDEIGKIFYTSKQNVSEIFKEMGYKPLTASEVKEKNAKKHAPIIKKTKYIELEKAVVALKDKVREVQQQSATQRYYFNMSLTRLRISYITTLMDNIKDMKHNEEVMALYITLRRSIKAIYNSMLKAGATENTQMFSELKAVVQRIEGFDSKDKV